MSKLFVAPPSTLGILTGTVVSVVVVCGLVWAQTVLIPVALGVFFAFLLTPLVTALQRWHLGRTSSVVAVVLSAGLLLGGVGWVVKAEFTSLVRDLPVHTGNIQAKIKYLKQFGDGGGMEGLGKLGQDISREWEKIEGKVTDKATEDPPLNLGQMSGVLLTPPAPPPTNAESPEPATSAWLSHLPSLLSPVAVSFGHLALALILVVFMLLEREALRNRLICLVGDGRMTATTKALEDVGARISRYLLAQLTVNSTYGLVWGASLFVIGVDYALLWGFLSAVLRYVPYIGATIAAILPITLSLAQFPGWWQPISLIAILLVLELVSNNVLEPWLYGKSIGVSAVAMMISAAFWGYLWGPVGLILAGPLTVCLVVLGKHVPELKFFAVLLGDAPSLGADVSYYQRLLARDQHEALELVLAQVKSEPFDGVYDKLLVSALVNTRRDNERGLLMDADEEYVLQATDEVLAKLGAHRKAALLEAHETTAAAEPEEIQPKVRILGCPACTKADSLALEMLRQLLDPDEWELEMATSEMLTAELVDHVTEYQPALICISALTHDGLAATRYLCKKMRAQHAGIKIIVGRWGLTDNLEGDREALEDAGADSMATTLLETRKQLNDWLPVLKYQVSISNVVTLSATE